MSISRANVVVRLPKILPYALKVLEEAAELVEAVKDKSDEEALEEFCDTLQALGNLASFRGWTDSDIQGAYGKVVEKNFGRGRY